MNINNDGLDSLINDLSIKIINAYDKFHTIEEIIIMPLEKNKYKISGNDHDIKMKLLMDLKEKDNIKQLDFEYFSYILSTIYLNYSNLGKSLAIKKIKENELYLKNNEMTNYVPLNSNALAKHQEFEKNLIYTIIYVLRKNSFISVKTDDNQLIKFYILELNEEYFNNFEFVKVEDAIMKNDFSNLNIYENNETPRMSNGYLDDNKGRKIN